MSLGISTKVAQALINILKLDNATTLGLAGTNNSLAYRVHEIEKHFHSNERWMGKSGDQSGTNWGTESSLTPFRAISGSSDFGGDADDEAKILGTSDTPIITGMVKFDLHRIFISALSSDTPYIFRIIHGTGTMSAEESAGNYSDLMVQNTVTGSKAGGFPVGLMMERGTAAACKVWARVKNATDNATCDFFVGVHEYVG